jgi:TRAP-type mannitol/chloroaromatic compound transport system permease small subunit
LPPRHRARAGSCASEDGDGSPLGGLKPFGHKGFRATPGPESAPGKRARGPIVDVLLKASRIIDAINDRFGAVATYLVLIACLISAGNALSRHFLNLSSNAWLEVQWYMFAAIVLLGGPYTLKINGHVRVDVIYSALSERARIWIDIVGGLLFLLPICVILVYFTWPWFVDSWRINEGSSNAGGLIRWPVKLLLPVGFALMALQGISEIIKRIAALRDSYRLQYDYETPQQ